MESDVAQLFDKLLTVLAFIAGLFADWFRQRLTKRSEEKQHIARLISDLLDLRHRALSILEMPKQLQNLFPKDILIQIPPEVWEQIDFAQSLPKDDQIVERYRKTVDEIAGFRPLLAYQLRGKEIYFDYRGAVSNYFKQAPGSISTANRATNILDSKYIPVIESIVLELSKCHSFTLWWKIRKRIRYPVFDEDTAPPEIKQFFTELMRGLEATAASSHPDSSSSTQR